MEWEDIVPQRGVRIKQSPGVTVALRLPKDGRPHISVSIGRAPLAALGWRPKQRVRVQHSASMGLVRLSLTEDPAIGYALHGAASDTTAAVNIPLPELPREKKPSEAVENRIEGQALIFALPVWARGAVPVKEPAPPPVVQRAETGSGSRNKRDAPLEVDAADPDARDRLEAMQELRKGKSVRDVARDFGFKIAMVASWQEQVLAERAAKGRAA